MSADQRRIAELEAQLMTLEAKEESLITQAATTGQEILRRVDASPACVLGLRIAQAQAKTEAA
jgi:hypothetical protein